MKNLVKLRKQKGMSQSDLAEILGVQQQTISKYENGIREPDNKTLLKISEIFSCSTDYLLGRTNFSNAYEQILNALECDPELTELCDKLIERNDLRLLIREAKDISPSKVRQIIEIIKILDADNKY